MSWDPDRYLRFGDHRLRPGLELIGRIPDIEPRRIVDLARCGRVVEAHQGTVAGVVDDPTTVIIG